MQFSIDTDTHTLSISRGEGSAETMGLSSPEAFDILATLYQNTGWHLKASYGFSWWRVPVVQLPEDMVRLQEVVFQVKPTVMIETGVSRGGSVLFYASLCHLLALENHPCRVIGIDHNIWPETRQQLENHPLSRYITLVNGDSASPRVVEEVSQKVDSDDVVMVSLDSTHDKAHVLAELESYAPLVTVNSYIVVQDGLMKHVTNGPRSQTDWTWNNPEDAAREFLARHPEFIEQVPDRVFTQSRVLRYPTQWPFGWLKRVSHSLLL